MSQTYVNQIKPFISVLIIIMTLFLIVFVKMEVRRTGYVLWKESRVEKQLRDRYYWSTVMLARSTGPDRIHRFAQSELDLHLAKVGQIIQMTQAASEQVAVDSFRNDGLQNEYQRVAVSQ